MADYTVTLDSTPEYVVTQEKTVVAENLSELADVSVSNLPGSDKFVLAYNASLAKFELIPADSVLTNAAADAVLPDSFVNQLDVDLDNKVDLDGGSF